VKVTCGKVVKAFDYESKVPDLCLTCY